MNKFTQRFAIAWNDHAQTIRYETFGLPSELGKKPKPAPKLAATPAVKAPRQATNWNPASIAKDMGSRKPASKPASGKLSPPKPKEPDPQNPLHRQLAQTQGHIQRLQGKASRSAQENFELRGHLANLPKHQEMAIRSAKTPTQTAGKLKSEDFSKPSPNQRDDGALKQTFRDWHKSMQAGDFDAADQHRQTLDKAGIDPVKSLASTQKKIAASQGDKPATFDRTNMSDDQIQSAKNQIGKLKEQQQGHARPERLQGKIDYLTNMVKGHGQKVEKHDIDRKNDLESAREWHDLARSKSDPERQKSIEREFGKRGINIKQEVLKAISRTKSRSMQSDLQEYQEYAQAANKKGLRQAHEMSPAHAANKVAEIRQKFADKNLDLDKIVKDQSQKYLDANPDRKEYWKDKWSKQSAPKPEAPSAERAGYLGQEAYDEMEPPTDVPEMEHAPHFDDQTRQEAESLRNKMVVHARKAQEEDPEALADDQQAEDDFWGDAESEETKDPHSAWAGHKNTSNSPMAKAITNEVGDDMILHRIIGEEVDRIKQTDISNDRDDALTQAVQNTISPNQMRGFKQAIQRADDPDQVPGLDLIAQTIANNPALSAALVGGGNTLGGSTDIEDTLFQSLKEGWSGQDNSARLVQKAIESLGGPRGIDDIMSHYYGQHDEAVPFMASGDIQRFCAEYAEQSTRRELNLPHDLITINRYAINPIGIDRGPDMLTLRFGAHWDLNRLVAE